MSKKTKAIPECVLSNLHLQTSRQFKALKRKQLKAVRDALNTYRQGCAFSPAYHLFNRADESIRQAIEAQSAKNWGR